MDILIGLVIKTIDIVVAIASFFEWKISRLLSNLLKRKSKIANKKNK